MENTLCRISKRWLILTIIGTLLVLACVALPIAIVDPYFHFHAPLSGMAYDLNNERYQNDGILRHFSYDAIITGTSMAQNFKCSQFDALWQATSIKLPLAGAYYKEINEQLCRAIQANPDIRYVLLGLDANKIFLDKDSSRMEEYPLYLYDNNPFNDVNYILNKNVLLVDVRSTFSRTAKGWETTSFDNYSSFRKRTFGLETIISGRIRPEKQTGPEQHMDAAQYDTMAANLEQNVLQTIRENPDITFLCYIPPYSAFSWESKWASNSIPQSIEALQGLIESLLPYENVCLFGFDNVFSLTCNTDVYRDTIHYSGEVSDWIMDCMYRNEHRLTEENYRQYLVQISSFYSSFDYDTLYR